MEIHQEKYENIYLQKDHLGANTSFSQSLRQEGIWVLQWCVQLRCSVPLQQESKANWSADICNPMTALLHSMWNPTVLAGNGDGRHMLLQT